MNVLEKLKKEESGFEYDYKENYLTEPLWVNPDLTIGKVWRAAVKQVVKREAGVVCSPGSDDQRFFVRGIPEVVVPGPVPETIVSIPTCKRRDRKLILLHRFLGLWSRKYLSRCASFRSLYSF